MLFSFSSLTVALMALSSASAAPEGLARRQAQSTCTKGRNMCVSATRNGTQVQYTLSAQGTTAPGWMGVGFGTAMGNAPMVILWSNSDGSISLSQRSAPGFVMPTVASSPPRVASLVAGATTTSGNHQYSFTVPADSATMQDLIFAYGSQNPGSASLDATLTKHTDTGKGSLNVSGQPSNTTTGNGNTGGNNGGYGGNNAAVKGKVDLIIPAVMGAVGLFAYML